MLKCDPFLLGKVILHTHLGNRFDKARQRWIQSSIGYKYEARAILSEVSLAEQHARHSCVKFRGRGSLRSGNGLLLPHPEKFSECPWCLRGASGLGLMKKITSGRIADLRDIIVMPIAVNADLLTGINQ